MKRLLPLVLWQALACSLATELRAEPLADVHLHWKWSHKEVTPPEAAIKALRSHRVALAVVTGTPPELALELAELAPDIVRPLIGIYPHSGAWSHWHHDPRLLRRTRTALETGRYYGIGEVHLIGGFISHWENPIIDGLFRLAAEFDVPILVHTEFSRPDYMLGLCQAHPATRFLWAHAGSILPPHMVQRVLEDCPNVWADLSARDPWRFVANPIEGADGLLLHEWRTLVLTFPDRFMVGSDAVWPVEQLDAWDEPDTGWQHLGRFLDFHRGWLAALPQDIAQQVRLDNARAFFHAPRTVRRGAVDPQTSTEYRQ